MLHRILYLTFLILQDYHCSCEGTANGNYMTDYNSLLVLIILGASYFSLTSSPFSMGSFCERPVNFTCIGSEVTASLFWILDDGMVIADYAFRSTDFPVSLSINIPIQGVTAEVTDASVVSTGIIDIVSTLFIEDVSVLNGQSVHCESGSGNPGNKLNISIVSQG